MKVSLSIPDDVMLAVDDYAAREDRSRSNAATRLLVLALEALRAPEPEVKAEPEATRRDG